MLDVNVSWPLQGKMWDPFFFLHLLHTLTSVRPHPFIPNPVLILGASICEFMSGLPAPLSCHIVSHTHRESTRGARAPFISHPPDQPANHLQPWMSTVYMLLLHSLPLSLSLPLSFPSWHPLSLPFAPFCFSCPVTCLSVFQSYKCWPPLSTLESSSLCEYALTVKGNHSPPLRFTKWKSFFFWPCFMFKLQS